MLLNSQLLDFFHQLLSINDAFPSHRVCSLKSLSSFCEKPLRTTNHHPTLSIGGRPTHKFRVINLMADGKSELQDIKTDRKSKYLAMEWRPPLPTANLTKTAKMYSTGGQQFVSGNRRSFRGWQVHGHTKVAPATALMAKLNKV